MFSSRRPFAGNRKQDFDVCSPDQAVLDEMDSLYPLLSNGFDENVAIGTCRKLISIFIHVYAPALSVGVDNPCYEGDDSNIDCEKANAECDPLPSDIDTSLYSSNDSITNNVYDLVDFCHGEQVEVCIPIGAADEGKSQFIGEKYVEGTNYTLNFCSSLTRNYFI